MKCWSMACCIFLSVGASNGHLLINHSLNDCIIFAIGTFVIETPMHKQWLQAMSTSHKSSNFKSGAENAKWKGNPLAIRLWFA